MNSFELNGGKGYKYTVQTRIDNKKSWLHLYYVETESGMVRFDFYPADDGKHKKRAEIIDESVRSLKEINASGVETQEEDEIAFENDSVALKLVGLCN